MASREHHDSRDDRDHRVRDGRGANDRDDRGSNGASDPWEALGPSNSGDFWHDVPDWGATASTSRRSGRGRIGGLDEPVDPTPIGHPRPDDTRGLAGTIRSAWDQLLGGGADATREHRRLDLSAVPAADPFGFDDDFDEFDAAARPRQAAAHVEPAASDPRGAASDIAGSGAAVYDADAEVTPADRSPIRGLEAGWMTEASVAHRPRRGPIDPLLVQLGAFVIIAALIVPLFVAMAGGDELDGAADTVASASSPAPAEPPAVADEPAEPPISELLDPSSLPPAIPVNTDASASASPAATAEPAADSGTPTASTSAGSSSSTLGAATSTEADSTGDVAPTVDQPAAADEPAARVELPECGLDYTVAAGDFWIRLADAAGVELADLLAVNGATVDTPLYPGAEICLPEGAATPAPPTTVATTAPPTTAPTTAPPTTAAPTTAPPTTAPPTTVAAEPPGPEEIKQIIRDVWPDELEAKALDIAYRESRFVPTAKNFCCYGLFQIYWEVHDVWLVDLGITSSSQLFDPETNARAALALYERAGGWGPWSTA